MTSTGAFWGLIVLLWLAQLADAVTTVIGVRAGAEELNPLIRWLVDPGSWVQMLTLKALAAGLVTVLARQVWQEGRRREVVAIVLAVSVLVATGISLSNWVQWMAL